MEDIVDKVNKSIDKTTSIDDKKEEYKSIIKSIVENFKFKTDDRKNLEEISELFQFKIGDVTHDPIVISNKTDNDLINNLLQFRNELNTHIKKLCILQELLKTAGGFASQVDELKKLCITGNISEDMYNSDKIKAVDNTEIIDNIMDSLKKINMSGGTIGSLNIDLSEIKKNLEDKVNKITQDNSEIEKIKPSPTEEKADKDKVVKAKRIGEADTEIKENAKAKGKVKVKVKVKGKEKTKEETEAEKGKAKGKAIAKVVKHRATEKSIAQAKKGISRAKNLKETTKDGGYYYNKYLKYKNKYLELKNTF